MFGFVPIEDGKVASSEGGQVCSGSGGASMGGMLGSESDSGPTQCLRCLLVAVKRTSPIQAAQQVLPLLGIPELL